jgi:hypothetical protein
MNKTLLTSPSTGLPLTLTAGDDAWMVMTVGDYLVSLEWDEDKERVMLFHNAHREDGRAWGLADSVLGLMLDPSGLFVRIPDPTPIVLRGLVQLNRSTDRNEISRLKDAITSIYPYLHNMPPMPVSLARERRPDPMFQVTRKEGDRTTHEGLV